MAQAHKNQRVINFSAYLAVAPTPAPSAPVVPLAADERFAELGAPRRVWAVGALNGDCNQLSDLHDVIAANILPGDRLVYLGNYLGQHSDSRTENALDEILSFRRFVLAIPGMKPTDVVYLRGAMEEMWQKLLTLQFCPNPAEVLDWMDQFGIDKVLQLYGSSLAEARLYLRDRPMGVTKWTNRLRAARRDQPGHEVFSTVLKRAAFTREASGQVGPMLFVHAGLDPRAGLTQQADNFWWGWRHLSKLNEEEGGAYGPYSRIVRGFCPVAQPSLPASITCLAGSTKAACFAADGSLLRTL